MPSLMCRPAAFALWFACASSAAAVRGGCDLVEITADHRLEAGKPVEMSLDALRASGKSGSPLLVFESDGRGRPTPGKSAAPSQVDAGAGKLTWLLPGPTRAHQTRRFAVCSGSPPQVPRAERNPPVAVTEAPDWQCQPAWKIATEYATYVLHKQGAGLASLLDKDGNDWISYRPGGGSAGEFRGIPNLGDFAHPGYEGERGSATVLESSGTIHARFTARSAHGSIEWNFFPRYARLRVIETREPFWFLYEGTPGGKLDLEGDYLVTSSGLRRPVSEAWSGDLPAPEWLYFGDGTLRRALFLAKHEDDDASDQFWAMEGNMTVFGFGRQFRCCGRYLTAPAGFTLGIIEDAAFEPASAAIGSAYKPISVTVRTGP